MKYRDLREFMDGLSALGELRRVSQPVSPKLEMTAIADTVLRAGGPALLFEKPQGAAMPCLAKPSLAPQTTTASKGGSVFAESSPARPCRAMPSLATPKDSPFARS